MGLSTAFQLETIIKRSQLTAISLLIVKSIELANTKFIPRCEGLSGTIGNLLVTETSENEPIVFPIDALVLDLTKVDDEAVETSDDTIIDA